MGVNTKSFDNASDMITFSRASGGYGLTKVSYGSELVTNGDFASGLNDWSITGTDATNNITVVNGGARIFCSPSASPAPYMTQSALEIGKTYTVTFDITASQFGEIQVRSGTFIEYTGVVGSHTYTFTTDVETTIGFRRAGVCDITIDNISVKEVTYNSSDPSAALELIYHPNDIPRIEYNTDGTAKGLLIEEARTNLSPNSNFNGGWTLLHSSLETDAAVSPDGTNNAVKLKVDTNSSFHSVREIVTGGTYAVSVFAKAGEYDGIQLTGANSTDDHACFNLVDGTAYHTGTNASNATIEDVGNGWYRCSAIIPVTDGRLYIAITDGVSTAWMPSFAGANATDGIYIYGAQIEAGSFPTSYIKTTGATATRALDIPQINVSNFINKSAGTFLATFNYTDPTNVAPNYVLGGPSNVRVFYNNVGTSHWQSFDGSAVTTFGAVDSGEVYKLAVAIKTDSNISTAKNGDIVATSTSGTALMTNIESSPLLAIGGGDASQKLNGHIKSITYYPRRLTDAQIQRLTQPISTPTLSLTFDGQATSFTEDSIHG